MIVKTTDKKTGKVQFFGVFSEKSNYTYLKDLLSWYGDNADLNRLRSALSSIDQWTFRDLYAIPLSTKSESEPVESRLQYRGYENDTEPLIVRGKTMPELEFRVCGNSEDYPWHLWPKVPNTYSSKPLTDCQTDDLAWRFAELLPVLMESGTLAAIKADWKTKVVETAKKRIDTVRKQLDEIEQFAP